MFLLYKIEIGCIQIIDHIPNIIGGEDECVGSKTIRQRVVTIYIADNC
ncbi:MAG: hypothetical protein ABJO45_02980 [Lentilitoribacter sp.]